MSEQEVATSESGLNFDDLTPVEVPVSIAGKKYILREASADAASRWRNSLMRVTKLGTDGKATFTGEAADTSTFLVSLCLFQPDKDGAFTKPVHIAVIKS